MGGVVPDCMCVCVFQNGLTPLHLVAQEGHVGIADTLVKHGASIYAASRVSHDGYAHPPRPTLPCPM